MKVKVRRVKNVKKVSVRSYKSKEDCKNSGWIKEDFDNIFEDNYEEEYLKGCHEWHVEGCGTDNSFVAEPNYEGEKSSKFTKFLHIASLIALLYSSKTRLITILSLGIGFIISRFKNIKSFVKRINVSTIKNSVRKFFKGVWGILKPILELIWDIACGIYIIIECIVEGIVVFIAESIGIIAVILFFSCLICAL